MNFFKWKIVRRTYNPSDKIVDQIKDILFPPLKHQEDIDSDGKTIKCQIDYSADSNLEMVLSDLQDGYNDENTQKSVFIVLKRLDRVRKLLEAYTILDADAKYVIVEDDDRFSHSAEDISVQDA